MSSAHVGVPIRSSTSYGDGDSGLRQFLEKGTDVELISGSRQCSSLSHFHFSWDGVLAMSPPHLTCDDHIIYLDIGGVQRLDKLWSLNDWFSVSASRRVDDIERF